jgi:hypothetical protein
MTQRDHPAELFCLIDDFCQAVEPVQRRYAVFVPLSIKRFYLADYCSKPGSMN